MGHFTRQDEEQVVRSQPQDAHLGQLPDGGHHPWGGGGGGGGKGEEEEGEKEKEEEEQISS